MNNTFFNLTAPSYNGATTGEYTVTQHLISIPEVIIIIGLFVFLAYWYNRVSLNKEQYIEWKNPNGNVINLYKKVRFFFWAYVVTVIVTILLQILFQPK